MKTLLPKLPSIQEIQAERQRRLTSAGIDDTLDGSRKRCAKLKDFIREAWHVVVPAQPYIENWHIELMCNYLEAVTQGKLLAAGLENRLLFNVPPGSMKSLLVCVFWPAWEWGPCGMPFLQVISTTYTFKYTLRDSRRFRDIVTSQWFQDRWPLGFKSVGEQRIENVRGGWRFAIPFGSLTGGRCDRLLIDDPHSVDTAESDADRTRAEIRFRESASHRLNDPIRTAIVLVMQRLHTNDLSGIILANRMPYLNVMLPMRFEPERAFKGLFGDDPRTKEGELLSPVRSPAATVDRDEAMLGAGPAAGQLQQRPSPRGGLLFKRETFRIAKAAPDNCRRVRGWDFASSTSSGSAWTVGLRLAYDIRGKAFYIENVVRKRVENPEPLVVQTAQVDGKGVEISIPQDPGQAAKVQVRSIIGALAGYRAYASPESGDKEARAMPVAAQAEAGNVFVVIPDERQPPPWVSQFLDEIETFPAGYMDQVDALSRAFAHMLQFNNMAASAMPIIVTSKRVMYGDHPGI